MTDEQTLQKPAKKSWLGLSLALLLALGAFFSGLQLDRLVGGSAEHTNMLSLFAGTQEISHNANLDEFWKVWWRAAVWASLDCCATRGCPRSPNRPLSKA